LWTNEKAWPYARPAGGSPEQLIESVQKLLEKWTYVGVWFDILKGHYFAKEPVKNGYSARIER
jgi:hypothetical protein